MKDKVNHIVNWIKDYADKNHKTCLVVGVSGGIDSSVVSTLSAMTGLRTIPIVMTIKNKDMLALEHAWWLEENFDNVDFKEIEEIMNSNSCVDDADDMCTHNLTFGSVEQEQAF